MVFTARRTDIKAEASTNSAMSTAHVWDARCAPFGLDLAKQEQRAAPRTVARMVRTTIHRVSAVKI